MSTLLEEVPKLPVNVIEAFQKLLHVDPNSLVAARTVEGLVCLEPSDLFLRLIAAAGARDVDLLLAEIDGHLRSSVINKGGDDGTSGGSLSIDGETFDVRRMTVQLTIPCTDAWFEPTADGPALRIAVKDPDAPEAFCCQIAGLGAVRFTHIADIKGRRVYEASAWRSEHGPDQRGQDPTLLLAGPFERGMPGVF